VNGAKIINTSKHLYTIIHNSQKTSVDALWREISHKKRNRNSPEMSTPHKQTKKEMNRYHPGKSVPTTNSFERLRREAR